MDLSIIQTMGGYAGSIVAVLGLITLIVKPLRERFVKWIGKTAETQELNRKIDNLTALVQTTITQNDELQTEMSKQSEAIKANLRDSILNIYYKGMEKHYMTNFELQNLNELYQNYKALGGNSFIGECVKRLKELDVHID